MQIRMAATALCQNGIPSSPSKEGLGALPPLVGLANLLHLYRTSIAREVFKDKPSTPQDWEVNSNWLLTASRLAIGYAAERLEEEVVLKMRYASTAIKRAVFALDGADQPERRVGTARERFLEAQEVLSDWLKPYSDWKPTQSQICYFLDEMYPITVKCVAPEGQMLRALSKVEKRVEFYLDEIRKHQRVDCGGADAELGLGVNRINHSQKCEWLQNLLCMSLREYALAVPVVIYSGATSCVSRSAITTKNLIERSRDLHREAVNSIPQFKNSELLSSIESRHKISCRFIDMEPETILFNRSAILEILPEEQIGNS